MQLRSHQSELSDAVQDKGVSDFPFDILTWVVPGGGKSWLPGLILRRFPSLKLAWLVPRVALREQACGGLMKDFDILARESDNTPNPSRNLRGFVASHQAVTANPDLYRHELGRSPYLLVTDEIHHAKVGPDGSRNELAAALDVIAPLAKIHLKMTGTLETNNNCSIWGCHYEAMNGGAQVVVPEKSASIYVRYNRHTAIMEGAITPIEFCHHDGPVKYIGPDGEKEVTLSMATRKDRSAALFTALKTEIAFGLLDAGVAHWRLHGDRLIVVCAFQADARVMANQLRGRGLDVALAISDEGDDAVAAIRRFKKHDCKVLVTCAMCYEGLDVPTTTHIICLTHIRSIPWIEQMLARSWRSAPGKYKCWAFVPEDPEMGVVIDAIRRESPAPITLFRGGAAGGGGGGGDSVIPLSSETDNVRNELLDLIVAPDVVRSRVVATLMGLGLRGDDPLIEQVIAKSLESQRAAAVPPPVPLTPTEEERRLRTGIHKVCSGADRARGQEYGTHWNKVRQEMGCWTKAEQMNLEQLRHAAHIASRICA